HGTFSSTLGSFGALATFDDGKTFLQRALENYDLVIGWNHRTLSVAPDQNASDLHDWLQAQKWSSPPVIDAIAYSRGGLVFRSLVEGLMPGDKKNKVTIGQAVFVGCTNGGTELANPANWHRFADIYVNLAAAGARALTVVPGLNVAGLILAEAISGLGGLLKVLATSATTDNAIPGLAAMNPGGPFIKHINSKQTGQPMPADVRYFAITSNFDPDEAEAEGRTSELPAGLALKLAAKAVDAMQRRNNDLVVNVDAMTQIDPDLGAYVRERLDYGTNGLVHHCRYFGQEETAASLSQWLLKQV
ncbi:MAG: CHAT domain-containing protein, partial [Gemmatimonadaceae bacterium]